MITLFVASHVVFFTILGVQMLGLDAKVRKLDGGILSSIEKGTNYLVVVEAGQRLKLLDVPEPIADLFFNAENPHGFYELNLRGQYYFQPLGF